MEKLIELLNDVRDDVDFRECTTLVEEGVLDSFDIIQIINVIDEEYNIEVTANEIVPENFNNVQAIFNMIQRLQQEQL